MAAQITDTVLMVAPVRFCFNPEAAATNDFMKEDQLVSSDDAQRRARAEFDQFAAALKVACVNVVVEEDTPEPHKPDSIFPNNWISTHEDGTIVLYPMCVPNRRQERQAHIVDSLSSSFGFGYVENLAYLEEGGLFLEGTGSLVLDRANKIAFANISSRMNPAALAVFLERMPPYRAVTFTARRSSCKEIYHTNVMMAIGETTAVVCSSVIPDSAERALVLSELAQHRQVVDISEEQLDNFAGNMLQLRTPRGRLWVMSQRAHACLTSDQLRVLTRDASVLTAPLDVIECHGGGSARCMLAEIFAPPHE